MKLAEAASRLNLRNAPSRRFPPLILMTDPQRLADPVAAAERLPPGSAVILRHYGEADRGDLAERLARIARVRGLTLLIGADSALALRVGAHGVHLPEAMVATARGARRRPGWLVTAAAHGWSALISAAQAGVDAALLSPVFPTLSHPDRRPLGPWQFATLSNRAPLPVYALGGVSENNAARLLSSKAVGIAAIGGLSR